MTSSKIVAQITRPIVIARPLRRGIAIAIVTAASIVGESAILGSASLESCMLRQETVTAPLVRTLASCGWDITRAHRDDATVIAGIVVALFTATLWWSTAKMQRTTERTLGHLEREFLAAHRPRLRVRNVVVHPQKPEPTTRYPYLFVYEQFVRGQLYVVNVGDSNATIVDSGCWVEWSDDPLPMERPYEGKAGNQLVLNRVVGAGESVPGIFQSERTMDSGGGAALNVGENDMRLRVMGWIEYRDGSGIVRRTTFCREYSQSMSGRPGSGHFVAVDNADYEHEE